VRYLSSRRRFAAFISAFLLLLGIAPIRASADDSPNDVFNQDALNKTLGALSDLRAKNLPIKIGNGNLDAEIANLRKLPDAESIIKKRGLSVREFVLTYKVTVQIREAEKARNNWQTIIQDPAASPQAKVEATQKLTDSLKNNLFTPEQIELVRRKMPALETLFAAPK